LTKVEPIAEREGGKKEIKKECFTIFKESEIIIKGQRHQIFRKKGLDIISIIREVQWRLKMRLKTSIEKQEKKRKRDQSVTEEER
jgi:hypothetical protein